MVLFTKAFLLQFKKSYSDVLHANSTSCGFQRIKSQPKSLFFLFLDKGQVLLHIIWRARHKGRSLVQSLGNNIQDALGARRGDASGLLDQEGYGVTLVQQPQLESMRHARRQNKLHNADNTSYFSKGLNREHS